MRRFVAAIAAVLAVAGMMASVATPASAQAGSGIGTCTATTGTQDVGSVSVGQQFVLQVAPTCVFDVGAILTVTVNGVNITGKVANVSGQVLITITVLSPTQLSVDDPVITPAVCGTNTVTVTGPSSVAVGGVATQTATFTVVCTSTVTTVPVTATTVAGAARPSSGTLSLTGTDAIRFLVIAMGLIAVGTLAVLTSRRRRGFGR